MVSLKKKILVTGGGGFLGSNVTRSLVAFYDIVVLEKGTVKPNRLTDILSKIKVYDINTISINNLFEIENIHYIIHCATTYGRNEHLSDSINTNVTFPLQLIENAINKNKLIAFFNFDSFFNKHKNRDYSYLNKYILTKNILENCLEKSNYTTTIFNLKLEHLYGINDNPEKFVPNIIHKLLNNINEIELTRGEQKRDFIYVKDVVDFLIYILENIDAFTEKYYNFEIGTGEKKTIREFVELAKTLTLSKTELKFGALAYRENEIMESVANIEKLKKIGWKAKYTIEEGINKIIESEKRKRKK